MAFNGSGSFLINSAGQPVVSGTVISSTAFNALTADLATGLSTCITKDGQTTITANIPMAGYKFTGLGTGSAAGDSPNLSQVQSTVVKLLASVSGADTITAVGSPTVAAYAAGQMFYFVAAGTNTGAVTLNIDSLGAKAVTRDGSTALIAGDIQSGEVCVVVYDGTRFQLINAANAFGNITVTGVASFADGSASDPSITNTGDTNTGIFFPAADTIAFTEGGVEAARIDSSGNFLVGATSQLDGTGQTLSTSGRSSSCTFAIQAENGAGYNARIFMQCPGVDNAYVTYQRSTNRLFASVTAENSGPYVSSNGTSWTTNSDERLKTDIVDIQYGLDAVLALSPKQYKYKTSEKVALGLIAQEAIKVIPEIVDVPNDPELMMGIEYNGVIPVLVKAIQEQQTMIKALEAKIAALEAK